MKRRGSLLLVAVIALIPVTSYLMASMNSGQLSNERRSAQDAADALAEMHGIWSARSLNTIAMNNVEAAQLLTVAIGSEALDEALRKLRFQSITAISVVAAHSVVCPGYRWWPRVSYCFYRHFRTYMNPARKALRFVSTTRSTYHPTHGIRVSHNGLSAIDSMNREIVGRFARSISEIAQSYLSDISVRQAHFVASCEGEGRCAGPMRAAGMSLPVRAGGKAARAEVCLGMRLGTLESRTTFRQKGFGFGGGPLTRGGSAGYPNVKDHINDLTGVGRQLSQFYRYYNTLRMMAPGGSHRYPRWANFLLNQSATGGNAFTRRFDAKQIHLCTGIPPIYALKAPVPEFWRPIGQPALGPGPRRAEDMPDAYRILSLVQADRGLRVAASVLQDPEYGHFGYSQATVYNPDGVSLFSQNWRAKLTPASRMDAPREVAADLRAKAPEAFAPLADILMVADGTGMEQINAH